MIIERGVRASLLQVAFEPSAGRLMQGNQPTLLELGRADHQAVPRDVVVPQPNGLGNTQPSTGQQREQCAIGLTAQGAVSGLCGKLDEPANLLVGENVRRWSRATLTTEDGARDLMARVFRVNVLGEAYDIAKASSALMN